jgi:putative methanogenesis marker protein 6
MSEERETRLILISPGSDMTPDQVTRTVHAVGNGVRAKETCYGTVIEGRRDDVRDVLEKVRALEPNAIFSKVRAFRAGDQRRCRAQHGSRPGFSQIEREWAALAMIQHGLDCLDRGEKAEPKEERKRLPVTEFKRICEERP